MCSQLLENLKQSSLFENQYNCRQLPLMKIKAMM